MNKAEWCVILTALACTLAAAACALTWAGTGYPASWLIGWIACLFAAATACGAGIYLLNRDSTKGSELP